MNFNSRKTINVFTDASIKTSNNVSYACAGAVAIFGDNETDKLDNITRRKGSTVLSIH